MPGRRSLAVPSLAAAVAAAAVLATAGSVTGLVSIVPVFLLLAPLLLRRYPGERQIARLRAARARACRPGRPVDDAAPATVWTARLTGGTVLGRRLAVRPPPAALAHA